MQLNFEEGDYNLSLHYYANGDRPSDEWQAQKNVAAFCKDLKKWCKQNMPDGYSLDYLYCTHTTTARGAIHHHMILRKDIPLHVIQHLWANGAVFPLAAVFTRAMITIRWHGTG